MSNEMRFSVLWKSLYLYALSYGYINSTNLTVARTSGSVTRTVFYTVLERRACWTASSKGNSSESRVPSLNGFGCAVALFDEFLPRKTNFKSATGIAAASLSSGRLVTQMLRLFINISPRPVCERLLVYTLFSRHKLYTFCPEGCFINAKKGLLSMVSAMQKCLLSSCGPVSERGGLPGSESER